MSDNPVVIGAVSNILAFGDDDKRVVSFRTLVDYHIGTDSYITRLDFKIGDVQMNVGFHVRQIKTRMGEQIVPSDELIMPKGFAGFAVVANPQDLIASFRGLADRLEQELAARVEAMKP